MGKILLIFHITTVYFGKSFLRHYYYHCIMKKKVKTCRHNDGETWWILLLPILLVNKWIQRSLHLKITNLSINYKLLHFYFWKLFFTYICIFYRLPATFFPKVLLTSNIWKIYVKYMYEKYKCKQAHASLAQVWINSS